MDNTENEILQEEGISREELTQEILNDYLLACESREASLLGRKEVLTGKAKFGIFGDGKEIPQIALAKQFQKGDFRSGYYRDQTFMMATGALNLEGFFAQLYANTDVELEPASAGRQMNGHYATRTLNPDGSWKNLMESKNSSADISPTAGQMPRLLGLAYASKFYRNSKELQKGFEKFSDKGNEVAFGTIGDASTSEGLFWESLNAAGVLQVPLVMSVWDDGHGISVPKKHQTIKESISEALAGFQSKNGKNGFEIFTVKGWDYLQLCLTYEEAVRIAREKHTCVLVHVDEVTQPQGHSTSGSHERYKSQERLDWEKTFDCIAQFKNWIISKELATAEELDALGEKAKKKVRDAKKSAWEAFMNPIKKEKNEALLLIGNLAHESKNKVFIQKIASDLNAEIDPLRKEIIAAVRKSLRYARGEESQAKKALTQWLNAQLDKNKDRYNSFLHSQSSQNALQVKEVKATYGEEILKDGREILRENFDFILNKNPEVILFGEDSGKIGGVNQGLEGLQAKYGEHRVFDTGIREATIIGQGIGMAMRGLRPIAEIQYLDYLLYALQIMSDDLATIQYRTKGGQKAPLIIRTRGHRLEGIWHAGSPMGMIIHALRGIIICVPRNMTQAAGFYNTLLASDEPGLVIESLNGYRLKEKLPQNIGLFKVPVGVPEVMVPGDDITIVSYGSMVRMCIQAAKELKEVSINAEVIDVQTLLPFDVNHSIVKSLEKTNRILFVDEDVPGGASAFMLQQVIEVQGGYKFLDAIPSTLSAKAHRTAYGSDGDYFSKPSTEDIFDKVYHMMLESNPKKYPSLD